ncbi:hypothetical protein GCM10009799_26210 [Nocardiopsis rhodophaea]|uniref:AB hydrolase-1 domain-containing protein n=1 Tax=Nocardiopsis rhodophaea TaxID=280238 RepID=A0ABP5EH61_9ACTN
MAKTVPAPPREVRIAGAPALAVRVREPEFAEDGAPGPPIVLVHALGRTLEDWEAMTPLLTRRHPLYAIDLRGHGRSEDGAWTLDGLLDDLIRVIGHFGLERPVVVGHQLGGMLAVAYGARSSRLTAVVNIEGHGWPHAKDVSERLGLSLEEAEGHVAAFRRYVVEQVSCTLAPMPPGAFDRMVEAYRSGVMGLPGPVLAASALRSAVIADGVVSPRPGPRAARALCSAFDPFDPDLHYRELKTPALTLVSTAPAATPPGAPARFSEILTIQAEHELIPRGDHLPSRGVDAHYAMHMSHPERVTWLIEDFLAGI